MMARRMLLPAPARPPPPAPRRCRRVRVRCCCLLFPDAPSMLMLGAKSVLLYTLFLGCANALAYGRMHKDLLEEDRRRGGRGR